MASELTKYLQAQNLENRKNKRRVAFNAYELHFIWSHMGLWSVRKIARALGRSQRGVRSSIERRIKDRVAKTEGYGYHYSPEEREAKVKYILDHPEISARQLERDKFCSHKFADKIRRLAKQNQKTDTYETESIPTQPECLREGNESLRDEGSGSHCTCDRNG